MTWSRVATVLFGIVLIAILTPLSQFLTVLTVNADVETATPVGYAVGILFSILLVLGTVRLIARTRRLTKPNLVILYCMLTLAVPVMNLGLVRQVYMSMQAVMREYTMQGQSAFRTAYNELDEDWFPVVPTDTGLAWNKARRLVSLLEDPAADARRQAAAKEARETIAHAAQRRRDGHSQPLPADTRAELLDHLDQLGPDELDALLGETGRFDAEDLDGLDLAGPIGERLTRAQQASEQAARSLEALLAGADDLQAAVLPDNWRRRDLSSRERITDLHPPLSQPDAREALSAELREKLGQIEPLLAELSRADRGKLIGALAGRYLSRYAEMDAHDVDAVRQEFVYRLTAAERRELIAQDGTEGRPDQDFLSFKKGLWSDLAGQSAVEGLGPVAKFGRAARELPWHLWVKPMVMWSLLAIAIFLLWMCVAEWLRRKWIDRENLPFPLVEVADHLIRHDARLETAADPRNPEPREGRISGLMLIGMIAAAGLVSLEAAEHYGLLAGKFTIFYDMKTELINEGPLRRLPPLFVVISPIIIGLAFLISLEMSFSIWATFLLFGTIELIIHLAVGEPKDDLFSGWAPGRWYPYPMSQLWGASLCFAGIILYKGWRSARQHGPATGPGEAFIPPRWNTVGLIVLPVAIAALLWDLGLADSWAGLGWTVLIAVLVGAVTLSAARVRAQTGLYTHHVAQDYGKLPLMLGTSGWMGSKVTAIFASVAFLPTTLLFRSLAQHLENMELARRNALSLRTVAAASLAAFLVALGVGMLVFPVFGYWMGAPFYAEGAVGQGAESRQVASYALYISHHTGEAGLDKWTDIHWVRIYALLAGFAAVALLSWLRSRWLKFPLHPIGYLVLLLSIHYNWVSPYRRGDEEINQPQQTQWIWASVLIAWLIKTLVIKYGGMNAYKQAKPLFVGLILGAVLAVFAWNVADLGCSIWAEFARTVPPGVKPFLDRPPYSPKLY